MKLFVKDKIRTTCEALKSLSEKVIYEVPTLRYIPWGYKKAEERPVVDKNWESFGRHDRIQGKEGHFWFFTELRTPAVGYGHSIELEICTGPEGYDSYYNPQGLVYLNGVIRQGIDYNHHRVLLEPDTDYQILIYLYIGMIGADIGLQMNLRQIDLPVEKLYYDMKVPYDAAMCYGEDTYTHVRTIKHLEQACNRVDLRNPGSPEFYDSVVAADQYLLEEYYQKECGTSEAVVSYIGHTHIDVAWLWTLAQTREKAQRSFATVLNLMEQYPEYIFMSSQPQLYDYLKQEEPELYEKVKEKVREGRWEVEGAMWLEPDCNIPSGESLIRQIMHGKKFMQEEFGVDSHILWLPDAFGFTAALPQIMKKCGVEKFITSKISWNGSNKMPYDCFLWEGLDGSEIFTYFMTAQTHGEYVNGEVRTTYNAQITPAMTLGTWERFQQKEYGNETMSSFGYGDGGGGPTKEMLEVGRRLEYGLPGVPKTQICRVGDFIERVEKSFLENCKVTGRTPRWVGELYLELCRGTYTSIAEIKKNNRECEFLCQNTETLAVIDGLFRGTEYPHDKLYSSWQFLLLNQFHDVLPGTSIKEVYEDSAQQYDWVRNEIGSIKENKLTELANNVSEKGLFVYNPNSFVTSGYIKQGEDRIYVKDIPSMGWKVIGQAKLQECEASVKDKVKVSDRRLESPHYFIQFDEYMNICSLYDRDNDREVIAAGHSGNQLCVFEDYPRCYDNWEISDYYKQKMWEVNDVQSVTPILGNSWGGYRIVRHYLHSTITQTIIIYSESRRIDFENVIDWHEDHVLLKAAFPTTIHANKATYEVQFGHIERPNYENTSWDAEKFEVYAHKWGDLSEEGYGVSVLNDCKYGYSTERNEISLTLIKCGTYPHTEADQGLHTFTYSLYPHGDGFKQGRTIQEAYLLNQPMEVLETVGGGKLPSEYSLVSCDCENIIIETVKEAENGKGIVLRLYDAWGKKSRPVLKFGFAAKKISVCDMLEQPIQEIGAGEEVQLSVGNFEIVTLLVEVAEHS